MMGNYLISNTGKVVEVDCISENGGVNGYSWSDTHYGNISGGFEWDYNIEDLGPIPISIEWLEKLGFYGKYKSCGYVYRKGDFHISSQDEDDEGNEIEDYVLHFHYNWNSPSIYYVHQLQNLYFIVTGEQLKKINLENSN